MTQIKPHEETIDGKSFVVYKLPPLDAQDLLIDILKALAPAVGSVAGAVKDMPTVGDAVGAVEDDDDTPIMEREIDPGMMAEGINQLIVALDKATMRSLVNTLAEVSTVDGMALKTQLPIVFREDFALMYRWLWFALKVQFSGFFAYLSGGGGGLVGRVMAAAMSPSTSSGDGS